MNLLPVPFGDARASAAAFSSSVDGAPFILELLLELCLTVEALDKETLDKESRVWKPAEL